METIELLMRAPDFYTARQRADEQAAERGLDGELLGWIDRKADHYSPYVPPECACDSEEHAYWERYAIHRGGKLKVVVDGGDYAFIYA